MSQVGTKRNRDRKGIGEPPLDEAEADLEDAQVAAVITVDEVTLALMNRATANGEQPDIQESHCECQARKAQEVTQHGTFQIEAVLFEVAVHFVGPDPAPIILQSHHAVGQVGSQAPGFFFACGPVDQQVGRVDLAGSQVAMPQPETPTGPPNETAEGFPLVEWVEPDTGV